MWWIPLIVVILLLFIIYIFLVMPGSDRKKTEKFFKKHQFFAHRGLWDKEKGIPENSLTAFRLAAEAGYGIELDLHVTKDDRLVVFHDDTLKRMTGEEGSCESHTLEELKAMRLDGTDETIPTFREVLDTVQGRSAFVVELKGTNSNIRVNELAWDHLKDGKTEYCIESFNPYHVQWWKKNHPEIVRGMLSCKMLGKGMTGSKTVYFLLEHMLLDVLGRPDFIAFNVDDCKMASFKVVRALGCWPVAWTVRTDANMSLAKKNFRGFIFEKLRP